MFEKIVYFPRNAKLPDRNKVVLMAIWGVVSFCFFIIINLPNMYRTTWPLYLLGIAPMMVAFNDKEFVKEKLTYDFKSLTYALYKGNMFFLVINVVFFIGLFEYSTEIWLRICPIVVFWFLSVPLSVIYNKLIWIFVAIGTFCTGVILWHYLHSFEMFNIQTYIFMIVCMVSAILLSLIISNIQIRKNFS